MGSEDDTRTLFPSLLNLTQIAQRDHFNPRQQDDREMFVVDDVVKMQHPPFSSAAVINDLGMQVSEVNSQLIRKDTRNLRIIRPFYLNATFIVALWSVQVMACIQGLNGVEHSYIRHMTSRTGQHVVQTGQKCVETGQILVIKGIAPGEFGQESHITVIVPYSMRDKVVDTLGVLLYGNLVQLLNRDIAHSAVRLGHHIGLVPVMGRGGNHLIEVLGRPAATYLVDTRHGQMFAYQHKVAGDAGRIGNLLLILMAGGKDTVSGSPVADCLHKALTIQGGVHSEEQITRIGGRGPDVIPQSRIERLGREAVALLKFLVEIARPHTALSAVHGRLVKEGGYDGFTEVIGKMAIISLMGILYEHTHRLSRQIVHIRVAVLHALANHYAPAARLGSVPNQFTLRFIVIFAQGDNLLCVGIEG